MRQARVQRQLLRSVLVFPVESSFMFLNSFGVFNSNIHVFSFLDASSYTDETCRQ